MFALQPQIIGLGAFVGVLVGLTGMGGASLMTPLLVMVVGVRPVLAVGSGTLVVVLLTLVTPLPAASIVGTDIAQAVMLLAASSTGHLLAGNVDLGMTGNLLIGSIPGVILGSKLCPRLPERPLRLSLAAV